MKKRVLLLTLLLSLGAVPTVAQVLYSNGPTNGNTDAWNITSGSGDIVTDSVCCRVVDPGLPLVQDITGFAFAAWLYPGDTVQTVQATLSSDPFGSGVVYFNGIVSLTQSGCGLNGFGFDICIETGTLVANINSGPNSYWLTLQNAVVTNGDPVYWDENSGPSSAEQNMVGTIPSESFTIYGSDVPGTTPEPGSIVLFATAAFALAGGLRGRLR